MSAISSTSRKITIRRFFELNSESTGVPYVDLCHPVGGEVVSAGGRIVEDSSPGPLMTPVAGSCTGVVVVEVISGGKVVV